MEDSEECLHNLKVKSGVSAIISSSIMEKHRCLKNSKFILKPNNHFIGFVLYRNMISSPCEKDVPDHLEINSDLY